MDKPPSSGLGRSIDELFQNLHGTGEEGRGAATEGPDGPSGGTEGASPDEPREVVGSPGDPEGREGRGDPGPGSAAPGSDPASSDPDPSGPDSDPAERFARLVADYLDADPEERDSLVPRILEVAGELRAAEDADSLAEGVVALSLAGGAGGAGGDEEALALARELLDGRAAGRIAGRIGAERDDEARESLGQMAQAHPEAMAPALTEALAEASDRGVRRSIMDALGVLGEEGRESLLALLEDHRWYAVRNAVVLLGEMGGDDVVQALTTSLGHDDSRVRRETVTALAKVGGEDAGLLLVGMLEDGEPEVRAAAATGVGILRVERAQRVLEGMLDQEDSEEVLVPVLRALGQLGDPGPVPAIEKKATGSLFKRPPREVRIAAYRALAAIGTPHARTVLRHGAGDKDPEVQHAVGMILQQMAREREEARAAGEGAGPDPAGTTPGRTPTQERE